MLEAGSAPPSGQSAVGDDMLRLGPGGDIEFSMAPGVADKEPQKGMYVCEKGFVGSHPHL